MQVGEKGVIMIFQFGNGGIFVYLNIALPQRTEKCFTREAYDGNTVQTFFRYKDADMVFAKRQGMTTKLKDTYALALLETGVITAAQLQAYTDRVCGEYHFKDCGMDQSQDEIYDFICRARYDIFGYDALVAGRELKKKNAPHFDPITGIDQRAKKVELLEKNDAAIFLLTTPELFENFEEDIRFAEKLGKKVYVCASGDGSFDMPDPLQLTAWLGDLRVKWLATTKEGFAYDQDLQKTVDRGAACLLFYGEEGLLHCRDLALDAIVTAHPLGYHAQALCNQMGDPRDNVIYIPRGTDITPYVPIIRQNRLTFRHLCKLWWQYGDSIYGLSVEQLYEAYPEAFVNFYDNGENALPVAAEFDGFAAFDENKEKSVAALLNRFSNVTYTAAYFDENLAQKPVCFDETQAQPGILVHTVRVKKAKGAGILQCPKGVVPRVLFAKEGRPGSALVSNFLFFMTPKLGTLYNDLRSDRPYEQTEASSGHLDYKLVWENGKRIETFPLFEKCCIAMTSSGEFLFFNYRLGGGQITLAGQTFRWEKADVDPEDPCEICVYTPFCTAADEEADRETYRKAVGEGRVNLVIFQDRLVCIRQGDVFLPGAGVVISLSPAAAKPLLETLQPANDGYYHISGLSLEVFLDGPEEVAPEVWKTVQWAYGGGLSVILDGVGMCDGDMKAWLRREGWMTPLSRQTQESVYHKSVKHPRTIIGTAENGDLLLLVFSGRTWRSTGANYEEIIGITRQLYPDVKILMNMDGGGSAVLGLAMNGSFMELSFPATSSGSAVGMVRPISTMLYIPAEEEML